MSWTQLGRDADAAWGHCQGSAVRPYLVALALPEATATSCTCPSRRFPCKHAVDLARLVGSDRVPTGDRPEFVTSWLNRRSERAERAATRTPGELADPEGAAKRAAERRARVADGLDELERWLCDQVRTGLAGLQRAGYAAFDPIAARMVDAQAPGVAGVLRGLPGELVGEGWPARLLDQFGLLHLLIAAHRRLDDLPPELRATVRSRIGYPVAKDDVLAGPGISDDWMAVGMVETIEYPVDSRRVWLYGADSRRWAMLLSFAPPGGYLSSDAVAGDRLRARLHVYPGSGQFRALVGARTSADLEPRYPSGRTLLQIQQEYAALVAADPWASRMPAVVSGTPLRPESAQRPWRLRDADGRTCVLTGLTQDPWLLVATATSGPVPVFGEWSPQGFRPLSVLPDGHGVGFSQWVEAA